MTRNWAICMHAAAEFCGERTNSCVNTGKTNSISAGANFSSLASVINNNIPFINALPYAGISVASLISGAESVSAVASALLAIFPKKDVALAAEHVADYAFQGFNSSDNISVGQMRSMVSALPYTGRKPENIRKGGEA